MTVKLERLHLRVPVFGGGTLQHADYDVVAHEWCGIRGILITRKRDQVCRFVPAYHVGFCDVSMAAPPVSSTPPSPSPPAARPPLAEMKKALEHETKRERNPSTARRKRSRGK